jgi:hypothetical protein
MPGPGQRRGARSGTGDHTVEPRGHVEFSDRRGVDDGVDLLVSRREHVRDVVTGWS